MTHVFTHAVPWAPIPVGKRSATRSQSAAVEMLCPVVADDWVNSEYRRLVREAYASAALPIP